MNHGEVNSYEKFNYGYCSFENYWGEEIVNLDLKHYVSGFFDTSVTHGSFNRITNIQDKTRQEKALVITYQKVAIDKYDYWNIAFETKSGKIFKTKNNFYCSISFLDSEYITLGVNGEEKTFYVSFSSSSGCSTKLIEVI
ncbi:TPA: hypothetical protein ACS7XF_000537 [Providencia alcalifaciens]